MGKTILAKDLQLADTVRLSDGPYMDAVVTEITKEKVCGTETVFIHMRRPYMHTADFAYTGGVIALIGLDEIKLWEGDSRVLTLLDRKELK